MTTERDWSLADRFVAVMAEVNAIDADVDNDNPHRYSLRQMKRNAEKVIFDALTSAADLASCARELKRELKAVDVGGRL